MALLEDMFKDIALEEIVKSGGLPGIAVGLGAVVLAPILIPVLGNAGKPLAKAVIKEGVKLYEKGKESVAEVGEVFEDILAEVRSELAQEEQESKAKAGGNEPQIIVVND